MKSHHAARRWSPTVRRAKGMSCRLMIAIPWERSDVLAVKTVYTYASGATKPQTWHEQGPKGHPYLHWGLHPKQSTRRLHQIAGQQDLARWNAVRAMREGRPIPIINHYTCIQAHHGVNEAIRLNTPRKSRSHAVSRQSQNLLLADL